MIISAVVAFVVLLTVAVFSIRSMVSVGAYEEEPAVQSEPGERVLPELDIQASLPDEVVVEYQPEIDSLTLPYAPGQRIPSLAELIPTFAESTVVSNTDGEIVATSQGVQAQANGQMTTAPSDTTISSVVQEGDVAVLTALRWQCGWMTEYVDATDRGDTARAVNAKQMLQEFPKLDAIVQYAPDFIQMHDDIVEPAFSGDVTSMRGWVKSSCPTN